MATYPTEVTGDLTGIAFPVSVDTLKAAGPAFLTRAFQKVGAIGPDNAVTEITGWTEFFGGGMGRKIKLDVCYAKPEPGLTGQLFAKFTREFGDPLRELFSPVMGPEVRFALLSRRDGFPVTVPTCFFADYNAQEKTGLLITARVPYGEEGVEPALDKCLDYTLDDPLEHYQAQTQAMAALAAYHRAGHFGDEIERQFPFDRAAFASTRLIPYTAEQLAEKLDILKRFAADAPQLLPPELSTPAFLDAFAQGALLVQEKELAILEHLAGQDDLIALCHWNMNPDNAWFWRDADGTLRSGQLDWGGVCQMNLAQSFFGMTCAAETEFLARHEANLAQQLLAEYEGHGGPRVDFDRFMTSVKLSMAVLGTAWMLDAPSLIAAEIADYTALEDRFDPGIRDLFIPRAQLQLMTVFLDGWRRLDIGAAVRALPS